LRHGTCVAAPTRSRELGLQQTSAAGEAKQTLKFLLH
jgi:hypothetical protein